jgi:hypothetical protein
MSRTSRVFQAFLFAVAIAVILSFASGGGFAARAAAAHTISAGAGVGGSISPSGAVPVLPGASATFAITPNDGYIIARVVVDGTDMGPNVSRYTFSSVNADHSILAEFERGESSGGGLGCDGGAGMFGLLAVTVVAALRRKK